MSRGVIFLELITLTGNCLGVKDRQGVSARDRMHMQPFDNPDGICTAIFISNITRKR